MIREEEIPDSEIDTDCKEIATNAKIINGIEGKIKPVNAKRTNDAMQRWINDADRIMNDFISGVRANCNTEAGRLLLRKMGNSPAGILKNIVEHPNSIPLIKKFLGVNLYKHLVKLPNLIKGIEKTHAERLQRGEIGPNGYKDFSKQVSKIKLKYDGFLPKQLFSICTEEINYFNY